MPFELGTKVSEGTSAIVMYVAKFFLFCFLSGTDGVVGTSSVSSFGFRQQECLPDLVARQANIDNVPAINRRKRNFFWNNFTLCGRPC